MTPQAVRVTRAPARRVGSARWLKGKVRDALQSQGYVEAGDRFQLPMIERHQKRDFHKLARAERIAACIGFLQDNLNCMLTMVKDSTEIDVNRIEPKLVEVKAGARLDGVEVADIYRWWNLVWWSLPHEKTYGRQIRYVIWDRYHSAPIGLIGLQSPILRWSVRDEYLGIPDERRDYWANVSMSAQRLGALPPYNKFLGGKLVASLMTVDKVRKDYERKYRDRKTLISQRVLPAKLYYVTTTGAYGKSSVYNRLRVDGDNVCEFIGYTQGNGSFHIPNSLYEAMIDYLVKEGHEPKRYFGSGPSLKMQNISRAMTMLGYRNGVDHGMKRAVYLFPYAKNLHDVVQCESRVRWHDRKPAQITEAWKDRWAWKRVERPEMTEFSRAKYRDEVLADLDRCIAGCERGMLV